MRIKRKFEEIFKGFFELLKKISDILLKMVSYPLVKVNLLLILAEVVIVVICIFIMNSSALKTKEQSIYKEWNENGESTQISIYLPENNKLTTNDIYTFRESYYENGISYIDTYSYSSKTEAVGNMGESTVTTVYADDGYFYFHPFKLKSGSYFTKFDNNKDFVVIDEYAAWKLFNASSNVENMSVEINDKTYYVKGVVEHIESKVYENAGLSKGMIFIPISNYDLEYAEDYDTISDINETGIADCYEVIMKNEVRGQAYRHMEELISDFENYKMVDYRERYTFSTYLDCLVDMQSMVIHADGIKYPYFENITVYYLYIVSRFCGIMIVCIAFILVELLIIALYVNKKFTD